MDIPTIRFDDGAAYEGFMGVWSRLAGERFLDWLAPPPGVRWVDVGCGNGAFTELIGRRCAPSEIFGIDPSEAQLAFARPRFAGDDRVRFVEGDAMALPSADHAFDAAVMALVLFFVPEPRRGVAEMTRVVVPGGSVSAYTWDLFGGGFPFAVLQQEMAAVGRPAAWPPSPDASRLDVLQDLWRDAGLVDVATCVIAVERTFTDFDAFWDIARTGPRLVSTLSTMTGDDTRRLRDRVRERLGANADGSVTCHARANAIQGRRPG